jgi:hypothetical protein
MVKIVKTLTILAKIERHIDARRRCARCDPRAGDFVNVPDTGLDKIEFNRDGRARTSQPEWGAVHALEQVIEIVALADAVADRRTPVQAKKNRFEDRRFPRAVLAAKENHGQRAPTLLPRRQVDFLDAAIQTEILKHQPSQ